MLEEATEGGKIQLGIVDGRWGIPQAGDPGWTECHEEQTVGGDLSQ